MNPITFDECNETLKPPKGMEAQVETLPVHYAEGQDGELAVIVSCWRPSIRERLAVLIFGRVWLGVAGHAQPPVWIIGSRSAFQDESIKTGPGWQPSMGFLLTLWAIMAVVVVVFFVTTRTPGGTP